MGGILFSPGQDPFSSFGRGYETSIANLLAMEREQRQRDEDAWLKKQRAGYDTAVEAFANAKTGPGYYAEDPASVQGANLDAYANPKYSGIMPPDELGTDTAIHDFVIMTYLVGNDFLPHFLSEFRGKR